MPSMLGERAVSVSARDTHSLALFADSTVWSWGIGGYGQLGHGDQQGQLLPKKVEAFAGRRVVAVSAGASHSVAVTADGAVWSWGRSKPLLVGASSLCRQEHPTASPSPPTVPFGAGAMEAKAG
uniref:Uncharacterized protein n=1 Tax=Emiliania huxleyi TaxID=2903 RepID=A0A7S3TL37_EMIHU